MSQYYNPLEVKTPSGGLTIMQRAQIAANTGATGNPLAVKEPTPTMGMLEGIGVAMRNETIIGTAVTRAVQGITNELAVDDSIDPDFNPYDLVTPELVDQFPWLIDDVENNRIGDFTNRMQFDLYLDARDRREKELAELNKMGTGKRLAVSLLAQGPELVLGGAALKAGGAAVAARSVAGADAVVDASRLMRATTAGARVTRVGLAGATNALQELGVNWINSDRDLDDANLAGAAFMGIALGGAVEGIASGARHVGATHSAKWIERIAREVRSGMAPEKIRSIADNVTATTDELKRIAKADPDGPRSITVFDTPEQMELVEQLRKKYGDTGHELIVNMHPLDAEAKLLRELDEVESIMTRGGKALRKAVADGTVRLDIADRLKDVFDIVTPAGRLRRSPSEIVHRLHRTIFDEATPLDEAAADPLNAVSPVAAENLKSNWRYEYGRMLGELQGVHDSMLKNGGKPVVYTLATGEKVKIGSRLRQGNFYRAVTDYTHRLEEVEMGIRSPDDLKNAPPALAQAAKVVRDHFIRRAERLESVGMLDGELLQSLREANTRLRDATDAVREAEAKASADPAVAKTSKTQAKNAKRRLQTAKKRADELQAQLDERRAARRQKSYLPHKWLTHIIEQNRGAFTAKLKSQFFRNLARGQGRLLSPTEWEIVPEVLENLSKGLPKEAKAALAEAKTIADMPDQLQPMYRVELDAYAGRLADATFRNMTDLTNRHGIQHAFSGGSPLQQRLLDIDPTDFAEYLDDDLGSILASYDHALAGRASIREAIYRDSAYWQPRMRELLNEDLSGDYEQVVRAIRADFQQKIDAMEQAGKSSADIRRLTDPAVARLVKSRDDAIDIFETRGKELMGMPAIPGDPAATVGMGMFLKRNVLRLASMSRLGKMVVSSLTDTSGLTMYAQSSPHFARSLAGGFGDLAAFWKSIPKDGLEGLMVAIDEEGIGRSLSLAEIQDLPLSPRWGTGALGKTLRGGDAVIDKMNRGFFKYTGMNRWNANWKRVAARMVMWAMYDGTGKMAQAADLVAGGMDRAAAFAKVGISEADAVRLNRLGLNAAQARRVHEQFTKHGLDVDGKPIATSAKGNQIVHPNLLKWDDAELRDAFTAAVNGEVDNIIVTPNLLSQPLFVSKWGFYGKVLHQFQSFSFAWGSQQFASVAQRPGGQQLAYATMALTMGAISDAIHNDLSGRRSLEETAELWRTNPAGMIYAATNRGGLTGWLNRPMGIADGAGFGVGPMLGNSVSSMQAARALSVYGNIGPSVDWVEQILRGGIVPMMTDAEFDIDRKHTLRKAMPFQNLIQLDAIYRMTRESGMRNPFGPGRGLDLYPLPTRPVRDLSPRTQEPQP